MKTSTKTYTSVLDTAYLPCGPWNGTDKFLPEPWSNYSSYQPLIVLPSKLIDMVPAWKSCTADMFEGQDPPRTLSPAAALVPAPTNANIHPQKNSASSSPSIPHLPPKTGAGVSQLADPGPTPSSHSKLAGLSVGDIGDPNDSNRPSKPNDLSIEDPGHSNNDNSPPKSMGPFVGDSGDSSNDKTPKPNDPLGGDLKDPGDSEALTDSAVSAATSPASSPTQTTAGYAPANGPSNPFTADFNDNTNTPLTFPPAVALQGHTITQGGAPVTISKMPVVYQSGSISAGGDIQAIPTGWGQGNQNTSPTTVGGLTFLAILSAAKAYGDPRNGNYHAADPAGDNPNPATYITVGGETIAVDLNAISLAGTTLNPGDPGVIIDGTPISLGSSVFVVGSRTETLSPSPTAILSQPSYIVVGGQTVSVSSDAISLDGTTLKPGDPGITVHGTSVSLGSSILVVGSHTQNLILAQPTPTAAPTYTVVGGETIAVAASSIVVAGQTMTPGGPAVLADGKLVSLGSSVLVVGAKTISFPLPTAYGSPSSCEAIGAMFMKGLGGVGVGTVPPPTPTAGYNGTRSGNGTMIFIGDAKIDTIRFKGWFAWLWTVLLFII